MLRAILLYIIIIIAVPIAFFRPFYGVLIYLWLSFGRPGDFVWPEFQFGYLQLVAAATLLGYLIFELQRSPFRLSGMTILLGLWVWLALASLKAFDTSLAYPKLWDYTRGFIMAFLTAAMANSEKRVKQMLYVLAISLGLLGFKGALDAVLTGFQYSMQGPGGMMAEQNEYALALNMGIPILLLLAKDESNRWVRIAFQVMAAGSALVVIGTRSRSGLLGLITVGLLFTAFSKRKLLLSIGLVLAALLLVVFGPQGALDRYRTIPTATEDDASAIGRLQAWSAAIKMTKAHPLLGVGPRNFMLAFPMYSDDHPRVTHNAVFDMLAETGIPGCALFLGMIFAAIGRMYLLWLRARNSPDTEHLGIYCLIVMSTLIVYLVPNMFINRQDFDLMYQLIAIAAGLGVLTQRRIAAQRRLELAVQSEAGMPLWQRAQG
jgi:probable O-glycosylation ligase (exosortase A-associated)